MSSFHERNFGTENAEQAGQLLTPARHPEASPKGLAGADTFVGILESLLDIATLPLVLLLGVVLMLNLLCLVWNITHVLNRRMFRGGGQRLKSCRWSAEKLSGTHRHKIWICADCGATAGHGEAGPPAQCHLDLPQAKQVQVPPDGTDLGWHAHSRMKRHT